MTTLVRLPKDRIKHYAEVPVATKRRSRRIVMKETAGISYGLIGPPHLGDCWKVMQHALLASEKHKRPIGIYPYGWGGKPALTMLQYMRSLIASKGEIEYVATEVKPIPITFDHQFSWKSYPLVPMINALHEEETPEYLPTQQRWTPGPHGRMCYQFRGSGRRQNFPYREWGRMLSAFRHLECIRVGLPWSLAQSIDIMCRSDFFLGIDSGMLHVARSTGVPIFINPNHVPLDWFHLWHPPGSPSYTIFRSLPELLTLLKERLPHVFPAV
jgi:hypothetical protein